MFYGSVQVVWCRALSNNSSSTFIEMVCSERDPSLQNSECSSFDSLLGDLEQCSARHCKQRVKPPSPLGASAQSGHTISNGSNHQSFDQSGLAMGVAGVDQFLDASHYECVDQFRQASYAPSNAQVSQIKPGITQIGSGVYRLGANPFQATAAPDVSFQQCSINLNNSLMASPCQAVGHNVHRTAAARNTPEPYADVSLSQQSSQSAWGSPIAPHMCMMTPSRVPCPDRVAPVSGPFTHSAPRQSHQTLAAQAPYSTLYAAPCEQQLPQQQQGFAMLSRQQSTNSEITTLAAQRTTSSNGMQLLLRAGSAGLVSIAGSSQSSMELSSEALGDALAVCMPQQQALGHDQLYEQYSSPSAEQYRKLSIALPAAAGGATAGKQVQQAVQQVQQAAAAQPVQQAQQPVQQQAHAIELVCQEEVLVKPAAAAAVVQAQQQQQAAVKRGAEQAVVGWFARCR